MLYSVGVRGNPVSWITADETIERGASLDREVGSVFGAGALHRRKGATPALAISPFERINAPFRPPRDRGWLLKARAALVESPERGWASCEATAIANGWLSVVRVLALTRWPRSAASSRQRFLAFTGYLARQGIEVTARPFFDEAYIARVNSGLKVNGMELLGHYRQRLGELLKRDRYDLLWVEKEALPQMPYRVRGAAAAGEQNPFGPRRCLAFAGAGEPASDTFSPTRCSGCRAAPMRITVANAALRDWVIELGVAASKVTLAPTGLDVSHYDPAPEPDGPFTLGWIGGPFTTEYLESIQGPLRRLSSEGVRLLVVGEDRALERLAGITVEQHPWSEADGGEAHRPDAMWE